MLRKLLKSQEARSLRWQKFNNGNDSPDYIGRRGLLLCYSSHHFPKQYPKVEKFISLDNQEIWRNFDLDPHEVLKKLIEDGKWSNIDPCFAVQSLIPKKIKSSLGHYIEQLVKFLNSKKLSRGLKNSAQDLLIFLEQQLFQNTPFLESEKLIFLKVHRLSYEKPLFNEAQMCL
jgi:hypothetical protein